MGQTSSQPTFDDYNQRDQPLPESQALDATSSQAIGSIAERASPDPTDESQRRRAKAERKAAKAERKARRRHRREERARQEARDTPGVEPSTPDYTQPSIIAPPNDVDGAIMPPKSRRGAAAIAKARAATNYAIDPQLEFFRHEGTNRAERSTANSAERSTANMVAPVANMSIIPYDVDEAAAPPTKKKRGRKSKAELQLAQEAADMALQLQNAAEPEDEGPRLLTELASAAHQAFEDVGKESKKRKRKEVKDKDADDIAETPGKKHKKKKFAKRTDGAASRSPSPEEESRPLPERGTFQATELKILDKFMDEWKTDHAMTQTELAEMIQSKNRGHEEAEGSFWAQVFDLLPRRKDRRSIRLTCRRRYHNFERRGKWEPQDDEELKAAYAKQPNKWTKIGEDINRMAEDCKDRWQNYLACGDSRRIGDWTEKEEMHLALAVEECRQTVRSAAKADAEKRNAQFRDDQDWMEFISFKSVSEKMGRARSGLQCRQHWKRMHDRDMKRQRSGDLKKKKTWRDAQAADNFKRMLPGDKYTVLQLIEASETSTEENIPWKMITRDNPDSKWTTKDRKVAFEKMKALVPPQATLPEEVSALLAHFRDRHSNELDLFYSGPVRSEDAPRKMSLGPGTEIDKTPAARIRNGQTSKRKKKPADKETAAADEEAGNAQAGHDAIDPGLEDAMRQNIGGISAKTSGSKKGPRGLRRTEALLQAANDADKWTALPEPPQDVDDGNDADGDAEDSNDVDEDEGGNDEDEDEDEDDEDDDDKVET